MTNTRPLASTPKDYCEDDPLTNIEGNGNSLSQRLDIDNSRNKRTNDWGPWVTLLAMISVASFCFSCWALWVRVEDRAMLKTEIEMYDRAAEKRDKEIRDEVRLTRNHVDALDNRVIVMKQLEDARHAKR